MPGRSCPRAQPRPSAFPDAARGAARALLLSLVAVAGACASQAQHELSHEVKPVTASPSGPDQDEPSGAGDQPDDPGTTCQRGAPTLAVAGGPCASRNVLTCDEGSTLQSRLEAIVSGCGFSISDDALELFLSAGCVTGLGFDENSRANDADIQSCLMHELGSVRAACPEQAACIRLRSTTLAAVRAAGG